MDNAFMIMQEEGSDFPLDMDSKSLLQSMTEVLDQAFESEYFGLSNRKVLKETDNNSAVKTDILDALIEGNKQNGEDMLQHQGEIFVIRPLKIICVFWVTFFSEKVQASAKTKHKGGKIQC